MNYHHEHTEYFLAVRIGALCVGRRMLSTTGARVFLSYARKDKDRVELLAKALQINGWNVFWDQDLLVGDDWRAEIERRLDEAHCLIAVWSRNSVRSDWVKYEAARGRKKGILIPVSIDGSPPPKIFDSIHTENLADWDGRSDDPRIARMVQGIRKVLARQSLKIPVPPKSVPQLERLNRGFMAGTLSRYGRLVGIAVGVALASSLVVTVAVAIIAPQLGEIPILWQAPQPAVRGTAVPPTPRTRPEFFMPVIDSMKLPENAYKLADQVRSNAHALLDGSAVNVRRDDVGSLGTYYRVVVDPPRSLEQAEQICGRLKTAGFKNCFLVALPAK